MKVTKALLKRLGACEAQREKFAELFPRGVVVTEALCVEHAQEFNWDWAANHLLSPEAQAEYNRVTAPRSCRIRSLRRRAAAEYDRVRALAWAEYNRVTAPAQAEYNRVTAPAQAEYNRVMASAQAEYDRVTALAFGRLASSE